MLSSIKTFLSPNVKHLVCDIVNQSVDFQAENSSEFDEDEFLRSLDKVLSNIELDDPDKYAEALKTVLPHALSLIHI